MNKKMSAVNTSMVVDVIMSVAINADTNIRIDRGIASVPVY